MRTRTGDWFVYDVELAFVVSRESCRYRLERGLRERDYYGDGSEMRVSRSEGCERLLRTGHVTDVGNEFEIERLTWEDDPNGTSLRK